MNKACCKAPFYTMNLLPHQHNVLNSILQPLRAFNFRILTEPIHPTEVPANIYICFVQKRVLFYACSRPIPYHSIDSTTYAKIYYYSLKINVLHTKNILYECICQFLHTYMKENDKMMYGPRAIACPNNSFFSSMEPWQGSLPAQSILWYFISPLVK